MLEKPQSVEEVIVCLNKSLFSLALPSAQIILNLLARGQVSLASRVGHLRTALHRRRQRAATAHKSGRKMSSSGSWRPSRPSSIAISTILGWQKNFQVTFSLCNCFCSGVWSSLSPVNAVGNLEGQSSRRIAALC